MERPLVAGVAISHPGRVLFPAAGATKLGLARYYETIGDWILPHVVDRPLTLVRCPTGVRAKPDASTAAPDCFFMKHSKVWAPSALRRVRIREKTKVGEYLIADSLAAVIALAQMDVLEIHTWPECLDFARAFAETVVRHEPRLFTTRFAKLGRERQILVDYLRNNRTNTSIAAYSTRAKPDAPVSVPVAWNELTPARPADRFTINTVPPRLARQRADPWKSYWTTRQTIPRAAARALDSLP
jgi:DNA primase